MSVLRNSVSALALGAIVAGGLGAATLLPARLHAQADQSAPAAKPAQSADRGHHHRFFDPARMVEGRIAFIKAVLKITPAQEQQFDKLADAMRENTKDRVAAFQQMRGNWTKPMSAVDRLEMRQRVTKMRVAAQDRVLAAFKPLYDSLTPDQKQLADQALARRMHRGMRGHGGRG